MSTSDDGAKEMRQIGGIDERERVGQGFPKDSRRRMRRTAVWYLLGAGLCVAVANVYALFGHGVRSWAMDLVFLCPLLLGAALFAILSAFAPDFADGKGYRLFFNLHNSGVAAITAGLLFLGILDIAGTGSDFVHVFFFTGGVFIVAGAVSCAAGRSIFGKDIETYEDI